MSRLTQFFNAFALPLNRCGYPSPVLRRLAGATSLCIAVFATALPGISASEELGDIGNDEIVAILKGAQLKIDDQAKGRCWTNLKTSARKTRELLESVDIAVYDGPILPSAYTATVELSVIADRDESTKLCHGSRTLRIWGHNFGEYTLQNGDTLTTINRIPLYENHGILLSGFNFNRHMLKFIEEGLASFKKIRSEAQRSSDLVARIRRDYPQGKVLLSWEEFDTFSNAPTESDIRKNFNADSVYLKHLEKNRF